MATETFLTCCFLQTKFLLAVPTLHSTDEVSRGVGLTLINTSTFFYSS